MDTTTINQAAAVAMGYDPPVLTDPPVVTGQLPGGLIDEVGLLHRDVEVRELTGADEEALDVALRNTKNPFLFTDNVIARAVVRIGTVSPVTVETSRLLLRGDRDMLQLLIRRATYGNKMEGKITCPHCGEMSDVILDLLEDIPVKELEEGNKRSFTVTLRNDRTAEVRLVTGADIHALGEQTNISIPEANTFFLSRCVLSIDGRFINDSLEGPEQAVRRLGLDDRTKILEFMESQQPGPKMQEVKVPCAICREDISAPISVAELLR